MYCFTGISQLTLDQPQVLVHMRAPLHRLNMSIEDQRRVSPPAHHHRANARLHPSRIDARNSPLWKHILLHGHVPMSTRLSLLGREPSYTWKMLERSHCSHNDLHGSRDQLPRRLGFWYSANIHCLVTQPSTQVQDFGDAHPRVRSDWQHCDRRTDLLL